jgi:leucyl aminopeptidase (aminopeptidase T)
MAHSVVFFLLISCADDLEESNIPTESVFYSVSITSSEGGTVNTSGGYYKSGEIIEITATSEQGYVFSEWMGIESSENPLTIQVNTDYSLSAIFVQSN